MGDTLDHPNFSIIDDFLDEQDWTRLWSSYQFMDLFPVTRTSGAWKLDDGVPLAGKECSLARDVGVAMPTEEQAESPLLPLLRAVQKLTDVQDRLLQGPWSQLVARPYVYPRGTGLSWHVDDHDLFAGAFVYYAHPVWNAHYGGELLVAETDGEALPIMAYRFETEEYSDRLLEVGCGNFIAPKPNRLVVLAGAPHQIAPVSPAAGHHVRASVAGFFVR